MRAKPGFCVSAVPLPGKSLCRFLRGTGWVHNGQVSELIRRIIEGYGQISLGVRVAIIVVIAIVTTVGGILVLLRLPPDHFNERPVSLAWRQRHPVTRAILVVLKNALGILVLPVGIVMSLPLVPGPGLVFMLLGLSLLDFPGKRALQRRLVTQPFVMRILNQTRARFGKRPFEVDAA